MSTTHFPGRCKNEVGGEQKVVLVDGVCLRHWQCHSTARPAATALSFFGVVVVVSTTSFPRPPSRPLLASRIIDPVADPSSDAPATHKTEDSKSFWHSWPRGFSDDITIILSYRTTSSHKWHFIRDGAEDFYVTWSHMSLSFKYG